MKTRKTMLLLFVVIFGGTILAQTGEQPATLEETRHYLELSDQLTTSGQIAYDHIQTIRGRGHEVVVNLAVADVSRNGEEGFKVVEAGMSYVHIPVSWQDPSLKDLYLFFDVMDAAKGRKVFVHCFANMRVAVFVYLYRTLREGVPHEPAWADQLKVWDPNTQEQWINFIEKARQAEAD